MRQPKQKILWFFVGLVWLLTGPPIQAEKIKLKGLDIKYNEQTKMMVSSGNAQLIHPDFTINADTISYNQKSGDIIGKNNVELQQNNQLILSDQFSYNTKTNVIQINELLLELTTPKKNQNIITKASSFTDKGSQKVGQNGIFTTCTYDPPHYYLSAKSFIIHPEQRIMTKKTCKPSRIYTTWILVTIYVYDIGKRKVIEAMPLLGENKIEGGFFKSQVDYVINDMWTGEAYIDYMSTLGIGLGTKLNFNDLETWNNSFYYYGITDSEFYAKAAKIEKKLTDNKTIKTSIESKNMYLIQGGNVNKDSNELTYINQRVNGTDRTVYTFKQSQLDNISPKEYHLSFNSQNDDNSSTVVSYRRNENSIKSDELNIKNQQKIGHNILNSNSFNFHQKTMSSNDLRKDQYLKA